MISTRRHGFTLLEVMLVVLLLGVLAAFLWPDFSALSRSEQLRESVSRSRSLIAICRAQAMNESRRYRLTLKPDGTMRLTRQKDPLAEPETYVLVGDGWAQTPWLLEDVWIEAVLPLPEGPTPLLIEDDLIEFADMDIEPEPLEEPFDIDFEPDGTSTSVAWVLRDRRGFGKELTLDGRLGRVSVADIERLAEQDVEKPEVEPDDEAEELEMEKVSP